MASALTRDEHIAQALAQEWPDVRCELLARNPWDLLIAVILSARTSDERVNQVMAVLTEHHVGPEAYISFTCEEMEQLICSVPLFRQKARSIIESARYICHHCDGNVPATLEGLLVLPGVGRKTAAVVLGNAFGVPAVAADVHVQRIAQRVGWTTVESPRTAEEAITALFLPEQWVLLCHQLIRLGRAACRPKNPWCSRCPIADFCQQHNVTESR